MSRRLLFHGSFASLDDRFVYQQVLKAACTTMKILFRELYDSEPLKLFARFHRETHRDMFVTRVKTSRFHVDRTCRKDQRDLLEAPDVLRFTIVRNPYTRIVSAWRDKVYLCEPSVEDVYAAVRGAAPAMGRKHPIEFAEFVSYLESRITEAWDPHWQRQVDLAFPKALAFTHVGKTEDLDATIGILRRHLKHPKPLRFRTQRRVIKPAAHYSEDLAQRVHALYEEDFTLFGYDPGSCRAIRRPPTHRQ